VFVYDTGSGQAAGQFMGEYDSPALNRDGSLLALSDGQKREVQVIDLASGAAILHLPGKGIQGGEAFSPDGAYLAYSLGAHAAVVELATGKSQELVPTAQSAPAYGNRVMHLVWSPDSQALAVATGGGDQQNGKVALWQRDAAGGFQELTYVADLDANYPMSIVAVFNPSGTRVALQGSPNNEAGKTEVVVYDLQQHAFIQSMQAYLVGQWVNDGTLLMIEASGDCRLTRLDVVSGQKTVGHGDCAAGNVYAPNGLYYAQTDRIPTGITIYHWATGATLAHAEHGGGLIDTSWSPDGRGLATVGIDGTVRVWPVNYP
jgi:WD40 repeat protein